MKQLSLSGISILYVAPKKVPPTVTAFLNPFHPTIWISIGIAYVMVPVFFLSFFLSRHLYHLNIFGVCHAAHCGPVHPSGVGALGRLRSRWQPHRGGQADVDDFGDHGDICDHDDRDTIESFKNRWWDFVWFRLL